MGEPTDYRKLGIAEKQAYAAERAREPEVMCLDCGVKTSPADLLAHMATRCPGPRDPGPAARWISTSQVLELGVSRYTASWWARTGAVRTKGRMRERRYLQRDVVLRLARHRSRYR